MEIIEMSFGEFRENVLGKEGIVLLGAGGDLNEWIEGVSGMLKEEEIAESGTPEDLWVDGIKLTTTGGRTDLALQFKEGAPIDFGKMAMWRLRFGECSWISDYLDNYASQHAYDDRPTETAKHCYRGDLTAEGS